MYWQQFDAIFLAVENDLQQITHNQLIYCIWQGDSTSHEAKAKQNVALGLPSSSQFGVLLCTDYDLGWNQILQHRNQGFEDCLHLSLEKLTALLGIIDEPITLVSMRSIITWRYNYIDIYFIFLCLQKNNCERYFRNRGKTRTNILQNTGLSCNSLEFSEFTGIGSGGSAV
jgi:hypothetical protein